MALQEYDLGGIKVKSLKTRAEFQSAIDNWRTGRDLDDSDFRELWRSYPAGQKLRLLLAVDKDFPMGTPKGINRGKRSNFTDHLENSEESRQDLFQKEARQTFAANLPDLLERTAERESYLYWQKWGGGENPEVWR